jgi:hypothetical protein
MAKRHYICDSSPPSYPLCVNEAAPWPIRTGGIVLSSSRSALASTSRLTANISI